MRPVLLTLGLALPWAAGCRTVEPPPRVEQPPPDLVLAPDGTVRAGGGSYRLADPVDVVQLERWLNERTSAGADRHLELAAERGTPVSAVQELVELLGRVGLDDWRISVAGPRD